MCSGRHQTLRTAMGNDGRRRTAKLGGTDPSDLIRETSKPTLQTDSETYAISLSTSDDLATVSNRRGKRLLAIDASNTCADQRINEFKMRWTKRRDHGKRARRIEGLRAQDFSKVGEERRLRAKVLFDPLSYRRIRINNDQARTKTGQHCCVPFADRTRTDEEPGC